MNAIDLLKDDHREVERLYAEFLESEDAERSQREEIFQQIERELLTHGDVEEKVFYPSVENLSPDRLQKAFDDHAEIKQILTDMLGMDVDDDAFGRRLTSLMQTVQRHVQEEEEKGGILELATLEMDNRRLDRLGRRILEFKRKSEGELAA